MTNETHNTNPIKTNPRRWSRFRLRTLLVMVTLLSAPLGWVGWELDQRRKEKAVVAWIEEMGGWVFFRYPNDERNWWEETKDKLLGERVRGANLLGAKVSDPLRLTALKKLEWLNVVNSELNEEQLEELRLALPNCDILID